jgi:hypothetical protein
MAACMQEIMTAPVLTGSLVTCFFDLIAVKIYSHRTLSLSVTFFSAELIRVLRDKGV